MLPLDQVEPQISASDYDRQLSTVAVQKPILQDTHALHYTFRTVVVNVSQFSTFQRRYECKIIINSLMR